jgi:hypothetical protein
VKRRPFVILGNPENRRVTLFAAALESRGFAPPIVVSWLDWLRDPRVLERLALDECWLRIDSAGESFEVDRELLRLGGFRGRIVEDRGRILAPRQAHLGFERALKRLAAFLARRPGWRVLNPIDDILELFDKRRTSARFAAAGVPVPESLGEIQSLRELDARMESQHIRQVFVKLSSGSSASCLGMYRRAGTHRAFFTTIEQAPTGWYNTLRVRNVLDARDVRALVGFVLKEGAQVERAVPKAKLDGAYFDLRVLCVAREPAFIVVRQNRHPITNLHLGGWRGDLKALKKLVPRVAWESAMQSCRQVASLYGGLHLGIDLMFEPGFERHRIIEANAFGDLLPNLKRRGLDVWEHELTKLRSWVALHPDDGPRHRVSRRQDS